MVIPPYHNFRVVFGEEDSWNAGNSLIYRCVAPIESNLVKLKLSEKKTSSHEGGPYGRPFTRSGAELIWFSFIRKLGTIRKGPCGADR